MRTIFILTLILFQIATIDASWAALGDSEADIGRDQPKLHVNRMRQTTAKLYSVRELVSDMHTVKEFIGKDGVVFAVSWQGNILPDLQTLLGVYYDQFEVIDEARPRMITRRPVTIRTDQVVVVKAGRMRDIHGFAYLPSRLPAGVQLEELK